MNKGAIARLEVTLDSVGPKVLRRVEVTVALTLDQVHQTLQAAFGWSNTRLFEFRAGDARWRVPESETDYGSLDAREATLARALDRADGQALVYVYDLDDGWEHAIVVERLTDPEPGVAYPRLVEAVGCCPPEDVGGPWGYADFLEAFGDPEDECHRQCRHRVGDDFDPATCDRLALEIGVATLAMQWARPPPDQATPASEGEA